MFNSNPYMWRLFNIFVVVFVVGVLALGGFLLVNNYSASFLKTAPASESLASVVDEKVSSADLVGSSKPTADFISFEQSFVKSAPSNNLTFDLAKELSKNIVQRNPEGPEQIDNKQWINVLDPETAVAAIADGALSKFDPKEYQPEIALSDLKIIKDSSPSAETLYLKTFRDILTYNFKDGLQDKAISLTADSLVGVDKIIDAYAKALKNFYELPAPESLVAVHQKEIMLLTGQKKIFEALAKYQEDPLAAFLAVQVYEQLNGEFDKLNEQIREIIQEHELKI